MKKILLQLVKVIKNERYVIIKLKKIFQIILIKVRI